MDDLELQEKAPIKNSAVNYGLILGLSSVALSVIMYILGMVEQNAIAGLLGFAILVILICLGINHYKKANQNRLSLSDALKVGILIAVLGGIIGGIYQILFLSFIEPDFMAQAMEKQQEMMLDRNPEMTDEQIAQAMEMTKKFSSPGVVFALSMAWSLFIGFIISLISGLIMKNE